MTGPSQEVPASMRTKQQYADRVLRGLCGWCSRPQHPRSRAFCRSCLLKNRKQMESRKSPNGGPGGRPRLDLNDDPR